MRTLNFFSEEIRFRLVNEKKTSAWIRSVIKKEGASIRSISYIFCSDEQLAVMNAQYLKHKTLTDIITFNYGSSKEPLEGDIFISVKRVMDNAKKYDSEFDDELHRVIIHGLLHLIGYNDKSKTEKALMRKKEDTYLSLRS